MILHLVAQADWDAKPSDQPYLPDAYAKDGFIHCTQGDALMLQVANRFYKDTAGEFLVLEIDESKVKAEIKWEAPSSPSTPPAVAGANAMPPEAQAEFGVVAAKDSPQPQVALFPHIYGPLNRDAIIAIRRMARAADGAFTGYAPAAPKGINLKKPSELADELVDATGDFSDALARYKDRLEAHMDDLDKNIKDRLG
ncbi:MAG: DUF952 domain-containing protein [Chloroflexi bacterium]|nr:DUF952 domain-containing protein [Chloroflexota bacterium]MCL5273157.1 DUF952 domain-containing protein [Chloroflexota bacterium]